MKNSTKHSLIIGFALFAMFFGAGNIIFPPSLGNAVGSKFIFAISGFLITGVGLPMVGIIACAKINGSYNDMANRVGSKFAIITGIALTLVIGPLFAIPRTAATTFELGIHPIFPSVGSNITIILYFVISLAFVLKPSSVVDNIGKILTPTLLLILTIIIVKGIIFPIGPIIDTNYQGAFPNSFLEGYQTMDGMGSVIMAAIVIMAIKLKGYEDPKEILKITKKSCFVAAIGLAFVYTGLMYLGTQTSTMFAKDISRTKLLTEIVRLDLGSSGVVMLSLAVSLACLTTSIALLSTGAQYFSDISKGKIKYKYTAVIMAIVSASIATIGVDNIITLAVPVLQILYPVVMVLIIISLLGDKVKNNKVVMITTYTALIISILDTVSGMTGNSIGFIKYIPFQSSGLPWIIPSILAFIISNILMKSKKDVRYKDTAA